MPLNPFAKHNLRSVTIILNGTQDTQEKIGLRAPEIFLLILFIFTSWDHRLSFSRVAYPRFSLVQSRKTCFSWHDGLTQYNRTLLGLEHHEKTGRSMMSEVISCHWGQPLITQCWVDSHLLPWPFPSTRHRLAEKSGSLLYFYTSA